MKKLSGVLFVLGVVVTACGGGTSVSSSASFCDLAAEREAQEEAFSDVNFFVPEEVQQAFEENRDLIERAVDVAPDEIKDDLELVRDEFEATFEALDDVDWDATAAGNLDIEESAEAEAAGERLDDYVRTECGIDPEANEEELEPTDEEIGEMLEESGSGDALVRDALIDFGFPEDQAQCLAETISFAEFSDLAGGQVPDEILDRFSSCGVSLEDLARFGGADPDDLNEDLEDLGDLPPGASDLFVDELVDQGFTEGEASCLADALFSDPDTAGDIFAALEACDIPLSRMAEIGEAGG